MKFSVLGTFEVTRDGVPITPSAPKLRSVLALLSVHANTVVHARQLVDELWDDRPPASCSTTLQTYIYQLRKLLGLAERDRADVALRTQPSGYLLALPTESLDLHRFETFAARGADEMRRGQVAQAATSLRDALRAWRGDALSDVVAGPVLSADITHLGECRNSVLEMRLDADLHLGRYHELISELTGHAAKNPTHEGLHVRLMRALNQSGRRCEALQVFHRLRQTLAEDLGLEPGAEAQRVHRAILADDPDLAAPQTGSIVVASGGQGCEPPAQLPAEPTLIGRSEQLAALERVVRTEPGDGPQTIVVVGAPGAGTSAFCVTAAHRLRDSFPDGQFYVDFNMGCDAGEVLGGFLRSAGVSAEQIPPGLAERSSMFRSWTAQRRVLVLLDNAVNARQISQLLPSGAGCVIIAAVHRRLGGHSLDRVFNLAPLPVHDSMRLLASMIGAERVGSDSGAIRALADLCGGLPLALRAAAATLRMRPHWRLSHLVDRLRIEPDRLQALSVGDLDLRDSVKRRYRQLPARCRTAFKRVAALGPVEVTAAQVAEIIGAESSAAEAMLEELVEFHLAEVLQVDTAGGRASSFRYRLHPLIRLAAAAMSDAFRPQFRLSLVTRKLSRVTRTGPRGPVGTFRLQHSAV